MFNHHQFYANIQKSDAAAACVFDLENEGLWKSVRWASPCKHARATPSLPCREQSRRTRD